MKKILYKFASRSRPGKFFACVENIMSLSKHDNYVIFCTFDIDDETMFNGEIIQRLNKLKETRKLVYHFGKSLNKINAINRDLSIAGDFDILCNHSDDMWFIKEGFDLDILAAFDNYDGLVHFPDQQQKRLITYAMMSKKYFDGDGYIYNPEFESVFADNFQQDQAKRRGMYKLVDIPILEHRHHAWGYGEADELLLKTENPVTYHKDAETYRRLTPSL